MSKGFLALDGLLVIASIFFATQIWRTVVAPSPMASARSRPPAAGASLARGPAAPLAGARAPLASYAVIGTKSLFSPARTEGDAAAGPAQSGPRPFLYGVVLATDLSIAYLEDPGSKRVTGYRVGDAIAGGTLTVIAPDHVVLKRSDGMVDVPLRDPAKPRAAVPETAPTAGAPPTAPGPTTAFPPPQMPPPVSGVPPQPPASPLPGTFPQLPPGLRRRLPVLPAPGAPQPGPDAPNR
jgi:Type II secretion system protein C